MVVIIRGIKIGKKNYIDELFLDHPHYRSVVVVFLFGCLFVYIVL